MADFKQTEVSKNEYIHTIELQQTADSINDINVKRENTIKNKSAQIEVRKTKFFEACTAIKDATQDDEKAAHAVDAVNEAIERMQTNRTESEKLYEELVTLTIDAGRDVSEVKHEWIAQSEKQFSEMLSAGKILISKHTKPKEVIRKESSGSSSIRPPKLEFDKFCGDMRKYPSFKRDFLKHIKPRYSGGEEAFVLKSYLDGEILNFS